MSDGPNADVRDLLPDLVHDRLDAEVRRRIEAHIAGCDDCRAERALLLDLRGARHTPRVDVAAIMRAVQGYRAPARRSWVGWRTAAAITVLIAGGSSVALLQRKVTGRSGTTMVASSAAVRAPATAPAAAPQPVVKDVAVRTTGAVAASAAVVPRVFDSLVVASPAPARAGQVAGRELAMGGGSLGDLSDRELTSLLKDIESLDAVPSLEVDNTPTAPIAPGAPRRATP